MRRVILCVFSTTIFVIVFYEILEYGGKKIEFLVKHLLKAIVNKLVDQGFTEIVSLRAVRYILEFIHNKHFAPKQAHLAFYKGQNTAFLQQVLEKARSFNNIWR